MPLRVLLLKTCYDMGRVQGREELAQHLIDMSHSRAWKINRVIASFLSVSILVGVGLVIYLPFLSGFKRNYLFDMVLVSLVVFVLNFSISYVRLRRITLLNTGADGREDGLTTQAKTNGATAAEIRAYTRQRSLSQLDDLERSKASGSCSICMVDYDEEDVLRRLPCGHYYHRACVDPWLGNKKMCPLCHHDITTPAPKGAESWAPVLTENRSNSNPVTPVTPAATPAAVNPTTQSSNSTTPSRALTAAGITSISSKALVSSSSSSSSFSSTSSSDDSTSTSAANNNGLDLNSSKLRSRAAVVAVSAD